MGKATLHAVAESLIGHPNIIDLCITAGIVSKRGIKSMISCQRPSTTS